MMKTVRRIGCGHAAAGTALHGGTVWALAATVTFYFWFLVVTVGALFLGMLLEYGLGMVLRGATGPEDGEDWFVRAEGAFSLALGLWIVAALARRGFVWLRRRVLRRAH